jgi:hypothetical protein
VTSLRLPGIAVAGLLAAAGVLVVAGVSAAAWSRDSSTAATANVVDRTFACATAEARGARTIEVSALSGLRRSGRLRWLAQAVVTSANDPSVPVNAAPLAAVVAGWPPPAPLRSGSLGVGAKRCTPTRARVALSPARLGGGDAPAYQAYDQVKCYAPRTVLVRVRAEFMRAVELRRNRDGTLLQVVARMRRGQVAVRTPSGKPLVYAEVYDSGRARLFTAGSCF